MKPRPLPAPVWITLGDAPALLASCAADPPETRMAKVHDLTTFHAREYVGDRVRRLAAIHRSETERLLAVADRTGDYAPFEAHCRFGVQDAIQAAIHAPVLGPAIESLARFWAERGGECGQEKRKVAA